MKRLIILLSLFSVFATTLFAENKDESNLDSSIYPQITNVFNRTTFSLNGEWKFLIDQADIGYRRRIWENKTVSDKSELLEYNFELADTLIVPGSWNMQRPELYYYEGNIWYRKEFEFKKDSNKRYFLHFGAVNYKAEVYLNGAKLGEHQGGFNPFVFEITNKLQEQNALIISVSNRREVEQIPTLLADWKNFGGITRDVLIIEENKSFVRDYSIQLAKGSSSEIEFRASGSENASEGKILFEIPELKVNKQIGLNEEGQAFASITNKKIELWSPDNPKLYEVKIKYNGATLVDKIGFRTIETKNGDIMLNGKSIYLEGISLHEESPVTNTRTNSPDEARQILNWVKELNGNYLRLSHYPHNEHIVRLADEMGILLWEEIPVYWHIDWENPRTYELAEDMLNDLITRDKNRASVIIWSMANETEISDARNVFLKKLIDFTRSKDPTRLISAALYVNHEKSTDELIVVDDPFGLNADIISVNQYNGWYNGLPDMIKDIEWKIDFNKPFVFSEFGAGALQGFHGDSLTRWSEEYQEWYYTETLKMCDRIDQLCGISPWILIDFQSPRRQMRPYQSGFNRKGIISDEGIKKKAFYVLQQYYNEKQ